MAETKSIGLAVVYEDDHAFPYRIALYLGTGPESYNRYRTKAEADAALDEYSGLLERACVDERVTKLRKALDEARGEAKKWREATIDYGNRAQVLPDDCDWDRLPWEDPAREDEDAP